MQANNTVIDNQPLLNQIKAHFTLNGTSLNRFCLDKGIDPSHASKAIRGTWKGKRASEIITLISQETGIEVQS
jgi:hypothetical protein